MEHLGWADEWASLCILSAIHRVLLFFSGKPILSSVGVTILSSFLLSSGAGRDGRRPRGFGNLRCSLNNLFQTVFLLLSSSTPLVLLILGIVPLKRKTKYQNSSFTVVLEAFQCMFCIHSLPRSNKNALNVPFHSVFYLLILFLTSLLWNNKIS